MMVSLLTHIFVTRPEWVKHMKGFNISLGFFFLDVPPSVDNHQPVYHQRSQNDPGFVCVSTQEKTDRRTRFSIRTFWYVLVVPVGIGSVSRRFARCPSTACSACPRSQGACALQSSRAVEEHRGCAVGGVRSQSGYGSCPASILCVHVFALYIFAPIVVYKPYWLMFIACHTTLNKVYLILSYLYP